MEQNAKYDAIVIGAGQGGGPLATALAGAGWKTALIEQEHVGEIGRASCRERV